MWGGGEGGGGDRVFNRIRASAVFGQGKAFSPPSDYTSNTAMQACNTMTEARIKIWRKKVAFGPVRLSDIPPTNEAAAENIKRVHFQVAHLKTAIIGLSPKLDP